MNILLCVVTRMTNRGVDALVASKAAALRETFPGCRIDVLTEDSVVNQPFLEQRSIGCLEDKFSGWRHNLSIKAGVARPLLAPVIGSASNDLKRQMLSYDLAIATGGDNFSSDYGSPRKYLYPLETLADGGVPVVMMGQSIGPFRQEAHRAAFMAVAEKVKLITARESATFKYLTETLGLPADKVAQTADTAFLLAPADKDLARKMIASFGIDLHQPKIAVSVSGGIAGFTGEDGDRHLDALERMSRRLLSHTDAQLLILPHVEDHDPSNNDLIIADKLLRRLDFHPRVRLARGFLTSNEYKALVGECDMVVAERMHVAIAGLSLGLPTFVIGYSVKGRGIMSDSYGRDAEQTGLVIPIQDFVAGKQGDEKILATWDDRQRLAAELAERLPAVRALARKNFELLLPIVGQPLPKKIAV